MSNENENEKRDDLLCLMHFGEEVVTALNAADVRIPEDMQFGAVMTILARNEMEKPIGGSINFDKERGYWVLTPEAQYSEPVAAD